MGSVELLVRLLSQTIFRTGLVGFRWENLKILCRKVKCVCVKLRISLHIELHHFSLAKIILNIGKRKAKRNKVCV